MSVGWGWNRESLQREAEAADRARRQAEDARAWFDLYQQGRKEHQGFRRRLLVASLGWSVVAISLGLNWPTPWVIGLVAAGSAILVYLLIRRWPYVPGRSGPDLSAGRLLQVAVLALLSAGAGGVAGYFGAMVTGVIGAALGRLLGHGAAWFGPGALYGGWTIGLVVAAGLFISLLRDDRR